MNLKKILAGVVAGAMALSAMSVAAFAEAEKKTVTVKGFTEPALKFWLNTDFVGDVTVEWTTTVADSEEAVKGSKVVPSAGTWWEDTDVTIEDIFGDLDPATITGVTINCEQQYAIGYNSTNKGKWTQLNEQKGENVLEDLCLVAYSYETEIEVNTLVTGEFEAGTKDGAYAAVVYNAAGSETQDAALTIKDEDIIVVSVTAPEDVDTSKMVITLKGYDSSWDGWKDVSSEEGELSLQTTVKALREANSLEKAEDLFGVNLEISGLADGAKVTYNAGTTVVVTLTDKPEESTSEEASASETTDASAAGTGDNNQPTGIAIAFVPAVIAATGVIVAKKRK